MDALVHWLASGMGPVAAFSTMAVALLVTALAPRHVKRRMRGALILGFLYGVLTLIGTRMSSSVEGHFDVRAIAFLCGALAIARFGFVLGVDLIIERAGAKPMNQLTRDILQNLYQTIFRTTKRKITKKASLSLRMIPSCSDTGGLKAFIGWKP